MPNNIASNNMEHMMYHTNQEENHMTQAPKRGENIFKNLYPLSPNV